MEPGAPEKEHFFDRPGSLRLVLRIFYALCVLMVALDGVDFVLQLLGVGDLRHAERSWDGWPGFYAAYGFVACVSLVVVAKQLRRILMRKEDYYDR